MNTDYLEPNRKSHTKNVFSGGQGPTLETQRSVSAFPNILFKVVSLMML